MGVLKRGRGLVGGACSSIHYKPRFPGVCSNSSDLEKGSSPERCDKGLCVWGQDGEVNDPGELWPREKRQGWEQHTVISIFP